MRYQPSNVIEVIYFIQTNRSKNLDVPFGLQNLSRSSNRTVSIFKHGHSLRLEACNKANRDFDSYQIATLKVICFCNRRMNSSDIFEFCNELDVW